MNSGNKLQRLLELRRKRDKENMPGGRGLGYGMGMLHRESHTGSHILRVFIWRSWKKIPIEHSSAFQLYPFRIIISTDWSV